MLALPALYILTTYAGEGFDLSLLEKTQGMEHIDATAFNTGNDLLPGEYLLKVAVNGEPVGSARISVKLYQDKVQAVFLCGQLASWGIHVSDCQDGMLPLDSYISRSETNIDLGENTLNITIPQKFWSQPGTSDIARMEDWDNGINAAFANYSLSFEDQKSQHSSRRTALYGTFNNGINIDGFQLRNNGAMTWKNTGKSGYVSSESFLQHDVDFLRGTFTGGDFYTSGIYFSGLPLRGIALTSNTGMLASEERNYVPAVIGTASSNATVVIRQNGFVIATRRVTPGPFTLKNIPAAASAGDMQVTVYEADGTQHTFFQPYNSTDMLIPDGSIRYYLYAGKNRQNQENSPTLTEADIMYGINNTFTLLSGGQYADRYSNISVGFGANMRYLGGFQTLINKSRFKGGCQSLRGKKIKLGYTKYIPLTGSYLFITHEHRLESGYLEFDSTDDISTKTLNNNFRNRYSLQLSQPIGIGNAVLSYTHDEAWDAHRSTTLRSSISYTVARYTFITSLGYQKSDYSGRDKTLSLNISVPLGNEMDHYITLDHSQNNSDRTELIAASGSFLKENQLSYSINALKQNEGNEFDSSLSYLSPYGQSSAAFRHGSRGEQMTFGMDGAVVVHHHGLTFGQRMGSSAALIHTSNVRGLTIENNQNVRTDAAGNAISPGLIPYHYNEEALYNDTDDHNIEVAADMVSSAPRQGAIVEMDFSARYRQRQFIRIVNSQNNPLAFGTMLYDSGGKSVGTVSASGIALVTIDENAWPLHINNENGVEKCLIKHHKQQQKTTVWRLQCR